MKYSFYTLCSLKHIYLPSGNKIGTSIFVEIAFEIGILNYLYNRKYNQIHLLTHELIGEMGIHVATAHTLERDHFTHQLNVLKRDSFGQYVVGVRVVKH